MNTFLALFLTGAVAWVNAALFFIGISALSGAVFFFSTAPLMSVLSIKAAAIIAVKYS